MIVDMERSTQHDRYFVVVAKQNVSAIVDDHIVHRRKVMLADVKFAVFSRNDRKVVNSVTVPHRQRILTRLQNVQCQ